MKTYPRWLGLCLVALLVAVSPVFAAKESKKKHPAPDAKPASGAFEIHEGFADWNGALTYYQTIGRGAPLVIVHGGPGATHEYFLPYLLPLARTNQLIFIDSRGSGRSEKLEDASQYTVENMGEDVEGVRRALGLEKFSLLGHSCGGPVVMAYAFRHQENLSHLILASTFASTRELNGVLARMKAAMPEADRQRMEALEQAGLFGKGQPWERGRYSDEYARLAWGIGYLPYLYGRRLDPNYDPADGIKMAWDVYREMWGSHGEYIVDGNLKSVEWMGRLPGIKVPTLVLVGDHDECDPAMSKEMHGKIDGSQLVILPESGHMTFVDQPNLFIKSVGEFVNEK